MSSVYASSLILVRAKELRHIGNWLSLKELLHLPWSATLFSTRKGMLRTEIVLRKAKNRARRLSYLQYFRLKSRGQPVVEMRSSFFSFGWPGLSQEISAIALFEENCEVLGMNTRFSMLFGSKKKPSI